MWRTGPKLAAPEPQAALGPRRPDMYSGSDSAESQSYTQWALNPAAYNNVGSDAVDWAALAQQWIIMKEAGPPMPDQMPNAPPAPTISKLHKKETLNEGGEAPMDVENDKDDDNSWPNDNPDHLEGSPWNWPQTQSNQQQPWSWNNSNWPVPAGVPPPNALKAPLLPTPPFNQFPGSADNEGSFSSFTSPTNASEYSGGYWTAAGNSKIIKPHNKRYSKVNVPVQVPPKQQQQQQQAASVVLDAAKRKQLPAWIREG